MDQQFCCEVKAAEPGDVRALLLQLRQANAELAQIMRNIQSLGSGVAVLVEWQAPTFWNVTRKNCEGHLSRAFCEGQPRK